MTLSLQDFKVSPAGRVVDAILGSPEMIRQMESLSRENRPAVLALDEPLAGRVALNKTERQHVGRWVNELLEARGWKPVERKNFGKRKVFSSGSVYARPAPAISAPSATAGSDANEGLRRARELVRRHSTTSYGVDDFIADKRREAERER